MVFLGFPVVFLWFIYGFPMVSLSVADVPAMPQDFDGSHIKGLVINFIEPRGQR